MIQYVRPEGGLRWECLVVCTKWCECGWWRGEGKVATGGRVLWRRPRHTFTSAPDWEGAAADHCLLAL